MISDQDAKILIVDDEPYISELLSHWLTAAGYSCAEASRADEAINHLNSEKYDLVVSDIMMPGISGIDLLKFSKSSFPDVAVIMVTAVDDRNTAIEALTLGAYGYVTKPFNRNEILINVANALERRRLTLLSLEYERSLEEKVRERTKEVREREQAIVLHLISASGYRDDETGAHIRRIGLYSAVLAKHLGWSEEAVQAMTLAAPMHDVGKIGVPDSVLLKPGRLTVEEFEVMKTHTIIGACILDNAGVPLLELAKEIALSHHEKWDGSGYPQGLAGEAIQEAGRIVAVVDVYDALVHARVYRPALPEEEVLSMMADGNGSHFEPRIFEAFLELLPEMRRIRERVQEEPGAYARMLRHEALNHNLKHAPMCRMSRASLHDAWLGVADGNPQSSAA